MSQIARKRVFASYSREDGHIVEPIVDVLRTTHSDVFLDVDSIEPGERWAERLQAALNNASAIFVFWSSHSASSEAVKREWVSALAQRKKIIPGLLDSTPLPPQLAKFQWIDFRSFLSPSALESRLPRRAFKGIFQIIFIGIVAVVMGFAVDAIFGRHEWLIGLVIIIVVALQGLSMATFSSKEPDAPCALPHSRWDEMAEILRRRAQDA